jgi:hypothetical protein
LSVSRIGIGGDGKRAAIAALNSKEQNRPAAAFCDRTQMFEVHAVAVRPFRTPIKVAS